MFAFGILVFIVLTGDFHPYAGNSNPKSRPASLKLTETPGNVQMLVATDPLYRPNLEESSLADKSLLWACRMCCSCWSHSPSDRPSFAQLLMVLDDEKYALETVTPLEDDKENRHFQDGHSAGRGKKTKSSDMEEENHDLKKEVEKLTAERAAQAKKEKRYMARIADLIAEVASLTGNEAQNKTRSLQPLRRRLPLEEKEPKKRDSPRIGRKEVI